MPPTRSPSARGRCSRHDALEALAARLQALPALVYETRSVPLGLVRGLRFGLVQHPQGAPEVYIEGALRRSAPLARDVHGPRAILNAVERLIGSAEAERDKATRDLAIAQGQLRDYEARLGAGFAHAAYLEELTTLRNQLEAALSRTAQEAAEASLPTVGALVARLKALHAAHTLDAAPERSAPTPHGHGRRGHHHAHSPARAGRGRAPARGHAGAGLSSNTCTAACHRAGASGHACPGTPGTLDASAAVAPVLGTAGRTRWVPRLAWVASHPCGSWERGGAAALGFLPTRGSRPPP